jgi:hypothetical protein
MLWWSPEMADRKAKELYVAYHEALKQALYE